MVGVLDRFEGLDEADLGMGHAHCGCVTFDYRVLQAELDRVDAEPLCKLVDQRFHREGCLGSRGRTIGG